MREFSFYNLKTGHFSDVVHSTTNFTAEWLDMLTPPDHAPLEGRYHPSEHRVDLDTHEVVKYRPDSPGRGFNWSPRDKCWQLDEEAQRLIDKRGEILRQINELEQRQLRPMRELLLDSTNETAATLVNQIEDSIKRLRQEL